MQPNPFSPHTPKTCDLCLKEIDAFPLNPKLSMVTAGCPHHFHLACYEHWSAFKHFCPICKSKIPLKLIKTAERILAMPEQLLPADEFLARFRNIS